MSAVRSGAGTAVTIVLVSILLLAQLGTVPAAAQNRALPAPAAGNVNCDPRVDILDALFIVQLEVQTRTEVPTCPLANPTTEILAGAGDVDGNGATNVIDALFIAQCEVGISNSSCPLTLISDLEVQWAEARAVVVEEILANGWGSDNGAVVGPGGMFINLALCPAGWDEMAGIDDGRITIGHTTALSGPLASYGNIAAGMEMYFDLVNERGGIGPLGYEIDLVVRDDGFVATQTQAQVDDLLANVDPFAVTTLGSPNSLAVQGRLNAACVPQPLTMSSHPAWGDPQFNPFTTGSQMSYETEALLWGRWIEENLDPGVSVAALVMDNDFGIAYETAFERVAEASSVLDSVTFVRHDPATVNLSVEIAALAAAEPDVYISMTAGNPCLLAMNEASRVGLAASVDAAIQPSVCSAVFAYLAPAGDAADQWISMRGGVRSTADPALAGDPFVSWASSEISERGGDPAVSTFGSGFGFFGWLHVEALRVAAELPGGLTRSNFLVALRAMETSHPMLEPGIATSMNGNEDAFLIEGSDVSRFDAVNQVWRVEDIIDLNGQTPNCSWVPGQGC